MNCNDTVYLQLAETSEENQNYEKRTSSEPWNGKTASCFPCWDDKSVHEEASWMVFDHEPCLIPEDFSFDLGSFDYDASISGCQEIPHMQVQPFEKRPYPSKDSGSDESFACSHVDCQANDNLETTELQMPFSENLQHEDDASVDSFVSFDSRTAVLSLLNDCTMTDESQHIPSTQESIEEDEWQEKETAVHDVEVSKTVQQEKPEEPTIQTCSSSIVAFEDRTVLDTAPSYASPLRERRHSQAHTVTPLIGRRNALGFRLISREVEVERTVHDQRHNDMVHTAFDTFPHHAKSQTQPHTITPWIDRRKAFGFPSSTNETDSFPNAHNGWNFDENSSDSRHSELPPIFLQSHEEDLRDEDVESTMLVSFEEDPADSRRFARWTPEEDRKLARAVEMEEGPTIRWTQISKKHFNGVRNQNQCKGRWKKVRRYRGPTIPGCTKPESYLLISYI